jgi:LmbE family N-acetylglucosaminyl deacetylase
LGASGLGQKLKRLQTTASAMHTAAHPDDEDSGLLAYLARREQARTASLSLNRGEGGRNVIGQELFERLGVITRRRGFFKARRLERRTAVFYPRFSDYGFLKNAKSRLAFWI